jgi:uncharacterized membrane protein YjgN (DUF898 family)
VTVADVGSTNGTLFEGTLRRDPFRLSPGAGFQIGLTRFRLLAVHGGAAPGNGEDDVEEKTHVAGPSWDLMASEEGGLSTEEAPALDPMALLRGAAVTVDPMKPRTKTAPVPVSVPDYDLGEAVPAEKTAFLETDDFGMATEGLPQDDLPTLRNVSDEASPAPEKTAFLETELAPALTPDMIAKLGPMAPTGAAVVDDSAVLLGDAEKTAFLNATIDVQELSEPDHAAYPEEPAPRVAAQRPATPAGAPRPETLPASAIPRRQPTSPAAEIPQRAPTGPAAAIPPRGPTGQGPAVAAERTRSETARVAMGEGVRPWFSGTGGEFFKHMILGALLCAVTAGIYMPWFIVSLRRWLASRVVVGPTRHGNVQLVFTGSGATLFVKAFVGYLLTVVTLGIYGFWFAADLMRFFAEHTEGHAEDGTVYQLRFTLTGGELFKTAFVGWLLCLVTIGIYTPWLICSVKRLIDGQTYLFENGQHVGGKEFAGEGGSLFGTFIVGYVLTLITLGIYGAWFQVSLWRWFASNTRIHHQGRVFQGAFYGTGGELFLTFFIAALLVPLTLGIYGFWFYAKLTAFKTNHLAFHPLG